ncbi:increased rDNA silencing protein 4-like [Drosophila obscura]|uniref:increased rDNA silencing protein 4-like n=1 Tax=Drosophila obscura TaxID=7282 RepID=UPI001BB0D848|nr:increased rDNA silencing protein 4-like [Drosophila obscura]
MIAQYVEQDQRTWDELLPELNLAVNSSTSDTTGFSPAFLMHRREPCLPGALYDDVTLGPSETSEDPQHKASRLSEIFRVCGCNNTLNGNDEPPGWRISMFSTTTTMTAAANAKTSQTKTTRAKEPPPTRVHEGHLGQCAALTSSLRKERPRPCHTKQRRVTQTLHHPTPSPGEHSTQHADPGGITSHVALHQLPELDEGPSTSRVALRRLAIAGDTTVATSQEGRPEEPIGELLLLRRENAVLRSELKRLRQREQQRRPTTGTLNTEPQTHQRLKSPPTTSSGTTTRRLLAPSARHSPEDLPPKEGTETSISTDSEVEVLWDGRFGKARPSMAQRPQSTGRSHQPRLREACPLSWQWVLSTPRTEPATAPSVTRASKVWIEAARAAKEKQSEEEEQSEEEGLCETETPADSGKGSETTDETDSEVPSPFPSRGDEDSTEEYPWTESGIDDGQLRHHQRHGPPRNLPNHGQLRHLQRHGPPRHLLVLSHPH